MAVGICAICGFDGPSELQHVAGRKNDSDFTVSVCVSCHQKILTPYQYVHRIPLDGSSSDSRVIVDWSTALGSFHIVEALCVHLGLTEFSQSVRKLESIIRFVAGISLDDSVPLPAIPKSRREPRKFFSGDHLDQVVSILAGMASYLAEMTYGPESVISEFFSELSENPIRFLIWCESKGDELENWIKEAGSEIQESIRRFAVSKDVFTVAMTFNSLAADFKELSTEYLDGQK